MFTVPIKLQNKNENTGKKVQYKKMFIVKVKLLQLTKVYFRTFSWSKIIYITKFKYTSIKIPDTQRIRKTL